MRRGGFGPPPICKGKGGALNCRLAWGTSHGPLTNEGKYHAPSRWRS